MSDDAELALPFPYSRSRHHAHAADRHRTWLDRHRELAAVADPAAYGHWEVAELAALGYPAAGPDELALAADLLGFYFLFDDQFDGALGRRPADVARICDRLTGILHGALPTGGSAVERAFADLWRRSTAGMPARWRARAATNWEWYFASHPAEAAGRLSGRIPGRESYLTLRRGTAAMETIFDMVERLGGFTVPQHVLHHPVPRRLRQLAADIPSFSNDVRSYPLEAPRGDVYNLVIIMQRDRACPPEEACEVVLAEAQQMVDDYARLLDELPRTYHELELDAEQRDVAQHYIDGITAWLAGYLHWERRTGRYRTG